MKGSFFHNQVFTKGALKRIVKEAAGFPRLINILCDNALITGFGYQRNPVGERIVKEVISDFRGRKLRRISRIWLVAGVCAGIILLGLFFTKPLENRMGKEAPQVPVRDEVKWSGLLPRQRTFRFRRCPRLAMKHPRCRNRFPNLSPQRNRTGPWK